MSQFGPAYSHASGPINWVSYQHGEGILLPVLIDALLIAAAWAVGTDAHVIKDQALTEKQIQAQLALYEKRLRMMAKHSQIDRALEPLHVA